MKRFVYVVVALAVATVVLWAADVQITVTVPDYTIAELQKDTKVNYLAEDKITVLTRDATREEVIEKLTQSLQGLVDRQTAAIEMKRFNSIPQSVRRSWLTTHGQ